MEKGEIHIDISNDYSYLSKFPLNEPVQIQFSGEKYLSFIRGISFQKFIIIDKPSAAKNVVFKAPRHIILRFLYSGYVYGLRCNIITQHANLGLLVLDYPQKLTKHNLRKTLRVTTTFPLHVTCINSGEQATGAILNISEDGALVAFNDSTSFLEKQEVATSFTLPNGNEISNLVCTILNKRTQEGIKYLGIVFDKKEKNPLNAIREYINYCGEVIYKGKGSDEVEYEGERHSEFTLDQPIKLKINSRMYQSHIKGWKKLRDKAGYLLVERPGVLTLNRETKHLFISYLSEGTACIAPMEYLLHLNVGNLWILKFSGDSIERRLRSDNRVFSIIPAWISGLSKIDELKLDKTVIIDINSKGIAVMTNGHSIIDVGANIAISFTLGEFGEIERQSCVVMRFSTHNVNYKYALQFSDMREENAEKLHKYMEFCSHWQNH